MNAGKGEDTKNFVHLHEGPYIITCMSSPYLS